MPFYYYARVRTYKSTNSDELTASTRNNNKGNSHALLVADKAADNSTKKQYGWYVIEVYKSTIASFDLWKTLPPNENELVTNTANRKVEVSLPTKDSYYTTQTDVNQYAVIGKVLHRDGRMEFTISNNLGRPRTLNLKIEISKQDQDTDSGWVLMTNANIWWDNVTKKQQVVKFTGAAGEPAYPSTAATWIQKAAPQGPSVGTTAQEARTYAKKYLTISDSKWSLCNKLWYYMVVDSQEGTATLWSSDENGETFKMVLGKKDAFLPQPSLPKKQAWNQKNADALKKAVDTSLCKGPNAPVPPIDSTTVPDFNVDATPPKDAGRWNPPPHVESRSVPYAIRSPYDTNILDPEFTTLKGIKDLASLYSETGERFYSSRGYSYLERGRIFQDSLSADVLNQTNTGGKKRGANEANQWGFRFMYNPQYISYETSANNSIDWTLGSKDTAALLAGNQTVTLQIYLNRIIDLGYLNTLYGRTNDNVIKRQLSEQAAYGRKLSSEEVIGIMNRGTEYDLEFLYRCLTGDPQTNNPLLNERLRKTGSADIGYITGIPLWLYLSDNLRYFGSVSRIGVNHIIFNTEMVPTLSIIDLSFARYPAQFANDAKSLESVRDNFFPPAAF